MRVAVVGAGVVGLAVSRALLRRGCEVYRNKSVLRPGPLFGGLELVGGLPTATVGPVLPRTGHRGT